MNFYAKPFVYITPLLALGILLGDVFEVENGLTWLLMAVCLAIVIRVILRKSIDYLLPFIAVLGFFYLGAITVDFARFDDRAIGNGDQNEYANSTMLLNVLEVNDSESLWQRLVCESIAIVGEDSYVSHREKVLVYTNSPSLRKNDQIIMRGSFKLITNKGNPGEFDSRHYWNSKNIYSIAFMDENQYLHIGYSNSYFFDNLRDIVSSKLDDILGSNLDESNLAVAKALILGDKSLLRPELKQSFSSAGAMHVLAVSGLHVGIILELLLFLFGRIPKLIKKNMAVVIALIILWVYAAVVGFSPSVVRATIMFTLLAIGRIYSKGGNEINILLFSACLMLFYNPLLLYDIGFQLSYLAMIGILSLYRPIESAFYIRNKWVKKIWQGTSVGIAAQLFTLPVTLYYFHQFPNYFLLTNVGMMVFAGLVLSLGLILFSTSWISFIGKFMAGLLSFALTAMIFFVEWIEKLDGSVAYGFTLPWYFVLIAYLLLFISVVVKSRKIFLRGSFIIALGLLVAIQVIRYQNMSKAEFVIYNSNQLLMTVKQGDEILCLHNASNGLTDDLDFLVEAYAKVNPGKLKYVRLGRGETNIKLKAGSLNIVKFEHGYKISLTSSGRNFFLRTSTRSVPFDYSEIIDMPYIQNKKTLYNLKNGCYRIPLNE